MVKYFIIVSLLIMLSFIGCKESSLNSYYTSEKITIDGKLHEWDKHPLQHFEEEHFSISFQHTQNELFLILATRDRQLMRIVQTSGIDIWLDEHKKKEKSYGLHYVGNIDTLNFDQMQKKERLQAQSENQKQPKMNRQKAGTILFKDFGNEFLIENSNQTDPKASVDMYKSVYLLEVRIPFSEKNLFATIKEGKQKKINVGLILGQDRSEMKKQMQASRPSGGRSGGMGGGGRGGGKGGGGKMGGGSPGDSPLQIGKIEKWFTVILENKK